MVALGLFHMCYINHCIPTVNNGFTPRPQELCCFHCHALFTVFVPLCVDLQAQPGPRRWCGVCCLVLIIIAYQKSSPGAILSLSKGHERGICCID